jgi:hypothetical protein
MKVSEEVDFTDVKQRVNFGIYEIMNRLGAGFAFPTQVTIQGVDPTAKGDNKQD